MAGATALLSLLIVASFYPSVTNGGVLRFEGTWLPQLGLNFTLRMDGFAWLFSMLIAGIGFLVVVYARYYMSEDDPVPRFFSFLLAFMGAMLGIVISGNVILLSVFWELTSIFSFLLISYWHNNAAARDGARMALTITGIGGFCLLIGLLLLGNIVGSYDLDKMLAAGDVIRGHSLYVPALVFILLGALTKSAQFPFHFWLPNAMSAPTPVSAFLHSATMVKAGVFLLVRFWPALSGTYEWFYLVGLAGIITLVLGAYFAMFQQDLKGLLAYSTISHLGLITLLLGLGSPLGAVAAIFHTVNHATFKASLFMATGIIDHEAGTRDVRRLSGLLPFMPITATLAMVAAAAMAGVPLLNGFLSKEMFLAEAIEGYTGTIIDQLLPALATLALAFSVLYSVRFIHQTFFGPPPEDLPRQPHEPPFWMRLPIGILVLACVLIGMFPAVTIGPFLDSAVRSTLQAGAPEYSLAIWHGWTLPLLLSVVALVLGAIGYVLFRKSLNKAQGVPLMGRFKGRRTFEASLAAIIAGARALMGKLGTRRLQPQLRIVVLIAAIAALLPFLTYGYGIGDERGTIVDPGFAVIWLLGGGCALGAAWKAKYHRVSALILASGAGLVSCISFVWLSAPDLALTQLLVETVTTVLLLLGLRWLPERREDFWPEGRTPGPVRWRRGVDLGIAAVAGTGMALLSYAIMTRPLPDTISRYFIENSYPEAGGRNAVNVTLVDFRAFDTLGEISVLAIVALTTFSLLRRFRPGRDSVRAPKQQRVQAAFDEQQEGRSVGDTMAESLLVPSVIMGWLFPIIVVFALYLLIRGHDLPGGGFAAGVTMSIALILQYMASGTRSIETRLHVRPLLSIGLGLLLAVVTGVGAMVLGYPFLTSWFGYADLPLVGEVPMATALLFDIGVFMVVVGTTALMLVALAHQSIRAPRSPAVEAADLSPRGEA